MDNGVLIFGALPALFSPEWLQGLAATLIYGAVGLVMFGLALWLMERLTPFSLRKELEEDQNVAVGVVMGCIIIGIAIIFSASISG